MKASLVVAVALSLISAFKASTPSSPELTKQGDLKATLSRGETVYKTVCISCHQLKGGGVPNMNPPLTGKNIKSEKKYLIGVVLKGLKGKEIDEESYSNTMPSQRQLSDLQVADVLTYVRNSFGNKAPAVTAAEVKVLR